MARPKMRRGSAPILYSDDFKRLVRVVSTTNHAKRDMLLILLSYGLGMRAMELAALRIQDVVTVDGKVKEEVIIEKTKLLKTRTLYITDKRIKIAVLEYIAARKERAEKTRNVYSQQQPLFLSQKNGEFSPKTIAKRFKILYEMAGFKKASSHSGRRTFATNLIENGADIKAVATFMGHSDINQTATYIQNNPMRLKRIISGALY